MIEFFTTPFIDELLVQYALLMPRVRPDVLKWRYRSNVGGQALIGQATMDDKTIGMTPFMRVSLKGQGEALHAYHAIDTIVHPDARGKGVFVNLGQVTCEAARLQGAKIVYGFPNAAAAKGWFKHNGWVNHGRAPFMIAPLRTGIFEQRLLQRRLFDFPLPRRRSRLAAVEAVEHFDDSYDELWRSFSHSIGCAVDRNSAYLNWRFNAYPGSPYSTIAVKENGKAIAFVTTRTAMKHGGHLGYVMEAMSLRGREAELVELLRWVRQDMAGRGIDAMMAKCFPHSPNYQAYRSAGFWPIPDSIVPIEIHFGSLSLASEGEISSRRENWYLSYLDSDSA